MSEINSLDLKSDLTAIVAMRILNAPRALVWKVWSDPDHLARWWGPNGFSITTHSFDMRPGGVWRFVMHGPDGRDYQNRITYEEVVSPERIVTRHGGGEDVEPVEFKTVVTLDDLGSRTRLTFKMLFASEESRRRIIETYGADKGLVQTLARLDAHLDEISGDRPMQSAMPFLWFDNNAEAAIDFYASLFPDARVINKRRNKNGALFTATLELGGVRYGFLNGGPHYKLTPAFSIMVQCDDQAEVDRLWSALIANGGEESRCGWLVDRFGLSWQIIPRRMSELMESNDTAAANRVTQAMLQMRKIDLAALERAFVNAA